MAQNNCNIHTFNLSQTPRKSKTEAIIQKNDNKIDITFFEDDKLDELEAAIINLARNTSFSYKIKKRFLSSTLSILSVIVIMFALISASIYEDLLKKVIFELPFDWQINDTISLLFVVLFFFGLVMMPSILDGESSQLKDILQSWFNQYTRRLKRLDLAFSQLDKKTQINLYNVDLADENHWMFKLIIKSILKRFINVNFYIRNDQLQTLKKRLKSFDVNYVDIVNKKTSCSDCNIELLLSDKEQKLYSLLQLSSTLIIGQKDEKKFISLELFEYCGKNFIKEDESSSSSLISGFQNFINRSFDDFNFLKQENSLQIYFSKEVKFKQLQEEQRRLSYYLRNHIEECVLYFNNPISLLILFYYVKDIVLDKKRNIAILEKFIETVYIKQHYELIEKYWFKIAGLMFDSSTLESFEKSKESIYRDLSIDSLNKLIFLFERAGKFEQAILLAKYLYETNPNKYSVNICSLYERMGKFDKAYSSLPQVLNIGKNEKPCETEVRYYQRKAWIVVSQRKELKKQEGLKALDKLKEILFSHSFDNEPLWLWHFYNIKANYAEWNKDYNKAIEFYKKCLSIPTLGSFEYGATFVNMAITYRFMFLLAPTQNCNMILESIRTGEIGLALKESVGDKDELPVVIHNQALNILCKYISNETNNKELERIQRIIREGITILEETNSVKRLGMLLIESFISSCLLNEDSSSIKSRLKSHWSLMDENEQKQIIDIYNTFVLKQRIQRIEFLDDLI